MSRCSRAWLGLGSNLDDPPAQLAWARSQLERAAGVDLLRCSGVYRSQPVSPIPQPDYANQVVEIASRLGPHELMRLGLDLEQRRGRRRLEPLGPRVLDVDLLLFGDLVLDTPELTLPHPRLGERRFVLVPLVELEPALVPPGVERSVSQLLASVPEEFQVEPWS